MALDDRQLFNNIKDDIMTELKEVTTSGTDGESFKLFDSTIIESKFGKDPKRMTYNNQQYTGIEAIIQIISDKIAKKVIEHLEANIQNNLMTRFDLLETDFNTFTTAMAGSGVGPATAVPAAVAAWLATSNTIQRDVEKTTQAAILPSYFHGSK